MNCSICGRELEYHSKYHKKGRGWVHKETDSTVIMKCKDCGYEGGGYSNICPDCGGKNYVDDHCVSPDWRVEPTGTVIPQEDFFEPVKNIGIFPKPKIEGNDTK
ncbi:hypothetical protein ES708_25930 [subsurface metagenome]